MDLNSGKDPATDFLKGKHPLLGELISAFPRVHSADLRLRLNRKTHLVLRGSGGLGFRAG